jgi:hypothetical protein
MNSDAYCEVWVESRSLAGVLVDDCQELSVSLYLAGGFSSLTFIYESARQIAREKGALNRLYALRQPS